MRNKFLFLFFILTFNLNAQDVIKVNDVVGRYVLSNDITPKQAKEFALEEAKKNALIKAGIPEFVMTNNKISDIFKKFTTAEISGTVSRIYKKTISETKDVFGNIVYEATITADVIKYETSIDPAFTFLIQGIDKVYNVNDHVTFTCKPFSDGYLHIFQIIDTLSSLVFPNVYEKDNSVLKNKSIRFPRLNGLAYSLDQAEENNLIFVFTKKNIVFNNKETIEGIFEWIYKIKPDQRQIQIFNVIVK